MKTFQILHKLNLLKLDKLVLCNPSAFIETGNGKIHPISIHWLNIISLTLREFNFPSCGAPKTYPFSY